MKDKSVTRQGLTSERHYVLPVPLHDTSPAPGSHRIRAPKRPMSLPSLTFSELKAEMSKRSHSGDGVSPGSLANAISALGHFMAERGCSNDECVGTHLRVSYYKALAAHVVALRAQKRSGEYIRNRKALLKRWRTLVLHLDREAAAQRASETPFQRGLRELFDGSLPVKTIAQQIKVPYATLKRWLAGSLPTGRTVGHVQALERHFGQASGALTDLLPPGRVPQCEFGEAGSSQQPIAYRKRLSEQVKLPYALKKVSARLEAQWTRLLAHKTSLSASGLKRQKRGKWSVTALPIKPSRQLHWSATISMMGKKMYCPTASIAWRHVTAYLGWHLLDAEAGGLGVSPEDAQSLALLLEPEHVDRYVEWRAARSGGALHGGIEGFLKFVASLSHPVTGYLTQSRDRFPEHADAANEAAWTARCQLVLDRARSLLGQVEIEFRKSRAPEDPLAYALALPNPLNAVADALVRMDAARPNTGGEAEALWARDRLIVKLLASNPLRAKNIKLLTIAPSSSGEAAQLTKVHGEWRIKIPKEAFKNFSGAAKHRVYDMPVRKEVWKDIEVYLNCYRPLLASASNPYLFVSSANPDGPFYGLNRRFEAITKRFFTQCPGVGPHGMRHLVATSILKRHPNAWAAAAHVLHDLEDTVEQAYAHLRSDDAARWVDALMTESLKGT